MSWGKLSHGLSWGPHTDTQLLLVFFSANCPPSNKQPLRFSRVENNFLWIAWMCSATREWQINRSASVVPFALHDIWMLWENSSGACCLLMHVWGCIHMNPAPLPSLGRLRPGASASEGKPVTCVPTRRVLEAETNSCSYIRCWAWSFA